LQGIIDAWPHLDTQTRESILGLVEVEGASPYLVDAEKEEAPPGRG
jgi:hypothetical protein